MSLQAWMLGLAAALATIPAGPGLEETVGNAVCGQRSPCRIVKTHDAGEGLLVVEAALHDLPGEEWKYPDLSQCAPWEVWVVCATGGEMPF